MQKSLPDNNILKYNENNKRWLSVGRPAFAHVNNTIDGADIAFNRLGNPFVVQKENPRSENINRQNKIVPLKYVAEKDYDLTLLSLGSVEGTNLSTDFRQYILNYFQLVQDSIDTILLKPLPKTIGDICSISIENNNNPVFTWEVSTCKELNLFSRNNQSVKKSSQPFDIKVPLSPGMNNIQISVYGKDASRLDYTITINKTIIPDAAISLIGDGSNTRLISENKDTLTYASYGKTNLRRICFQFNTFWKILINNKFYYANSCIDFKFKTTYDDNSDTNEVIFVNDKGIKKVVRIINGSSSPIADTSFINNNSSSSDFLSQSSSSSSNGENVSSVNSSSNIVISSSSVLYSSSSMNVIPQEFQTLIPYKLLSQENLIISDRVKLSGGSFGCSNANIGANAKIYGNLSVKKNVELRSNSYVQSLLYGSSLNAQHGASYGSAIKQTNIFPSIPTVNVIAGSNNIQVLNNKTITLSPSRYGKLHIYSNSNVYFEPGEYFFESVQIEPDVKLQFKNTISPIHLWIKNEFNYGDRVNALLEGQINNLFIYTGASNIYLGVSSSLNAILVAPNASVDMASRYKWLGKIWAKNITIQPDVNIE